MRLFTLIDFHKCCYFSIIMIMLKVSFNYENKNIYVTNLMSRKAIIIDYIENLCCNSFRFEALYWLITQTTNQVERLYKKSMPKQCWIATYSLTRSYSYVIQFQDHLFLSKKKETIAVLGTWLIFHSIYSATPGWSSPQVIRLPITSLSVTLFWFDSRSCCNFFVNFLMLIFL